MKTIDKMPADWAVSVDGDALIESLATGKPLDPETRKRIRERGRKLTDEIRRDRGEMAIAVDLIREARDA